jgi:hypothetical protein
MSTLTVNSEAAYELITDCLRAKLVPFLTGSPGIGKSSIVHQLANESGLEVIDMRLSQCDPTDLLGFPRIDNSSDKASYAPMSTFPLSTDEVPQGKQGWLLFLDEFNSAPMAVQAAAYKLVLDRQVGQHKLHDKVAIVCAGNLDTDNAIVNRISTAMQSRLVHLQLEADHESWLKWAAKNGIDHRVISYIQWRPEHLHQFNPDHNDKTFPCARTWEFTSRLIKQWDAIPHSKLPLLAGTISQGTAYEFFEFCQIFQDLPSIEQIVSNPTGIEVPEEPSIQFAITGAIGSSCNADNIEPLMQFVERMPVEFQIITLRTAIGRDPALSQNPAVRKWIAKNAQELF